MSEKDTRAMTDSTVAVKGETVPDADPSVDDVQIENAELRTFTPFQDLPVELHLKIWKLAAHIARDVQVFGPPKLDPDAATTDIVPVTRFRCANPVPAMLHVSVEAREEGLKYYSPWFKVGDTEERSIYVNIEVDTLFVRVPRFKVNWLHTTSTTMRGAYPTALPSWSPPFCRYIGLLHERDVDRLLRLGGRDTESWCLMQMMFIIKKDFGYGPASHKVAKKVPRELVRRAIVNEPVQAPPPGPVANLRRLPARRYHSSGVVKGWDEVWNALFEDAAIPAQQSIVH